MDLTVAECNDIFNALVAGNYKVTFISMCRKAGDSYRDAEDLFDAQRESYLKQRREINYSEPE